MAEETTSDPFEPQVDGGKPVGSEAPEGQEEPAGAWPSGTKPDQEGKQVLTEK